jgi:EAL domain-containing protein (putative c-di-GMP-specific phosphodiesterase class I)
LATHTLIQPSRLEIEILETNELDDIMLTTKVINDCGAMGVSFALNDFGTGYLSHT